MSRTRTYRCLNCLEHTVSREFDTSHLSVTCPNCESFERFVNEAVYRQFRAFEESPPTEIDWERLDRTERLVVAERIARSTKTIEDFAVVESNGDGNGAEDGDGNGAEDGDGNGAEDGDENADDPAEAPTPE
ncbi:hypothetical protein [Halorubrum amylolyticum]|uniref:hypothetical protein n=1 Tax=Halorubrum amylolyticum TaxID=2508724 RepID=UPI001008F7BA|nr:hypothetical protein [Halorubrum amylolyticum]